MHIKNFILLACLPCFLSGCKQRSKKEETAKILTVPVEHITPTADQLLRRKQSEAYCKSYDIPVYTNPNALFVDAEAEATIRLKDEVVNRALALCYMGLRSEGIEQSTLDNMNQQYHLASKFSDSERVYVKRRLLPHSKQQMQTGGTKVCTSCYGHWALLIH